MTARCSLVDMGTRGGAGEIALTFLGTGASGGTPGRGRSRRRESSLLVDDGETRLLLDVTRDFAAQATLLDGAPTAALLTHAHRDAAGGLPLLAAWAAARGLAMPPVVAGAAAAATVQARHRRLRVPWLAAAPGETRRIGRFRVTPLEVPHARDARFPTFAWRIARGSLAVVYASDVARLTPSLRALARGAALLAIDGAMWGRPFFPHLTIDAELPRLCRWPVGAIVLTQIGRTAPPHARLARLVAALCPRALPAWDGLRLALTSAPARPTVSHR